MRLKEVVWAEHYENPSVDLEQELSEEMARKIEDLWEEWGRMEDENDVHGDGTEALYGGWDFPYRWFRSEALIIEDELREIYGVEHPYLG